MKSKKEMVQVMLDGHVLTDPYGAELSWDVSKDGFKWVNSDGSVEYHGLDLIAQRVPSIWQIKPEPKTRLMTREEVLGFLANTPGVVVRVGVANWNIPWALEYTSKCISRYQWATITPDGKIGKPRKFEVEED